VILKLIRGWIGVKEGKGGGLPVYLTTNREGNKAKKKEDFWDKKKLTGSGVKRGLNYPTPYFSSKGLANQHLGEGRERG